MAQKFQSKTACAQSLTSDAQKKNIKKNTEIFRFVLIRNTFTLLHCFELVANLYQFIQFQIALSYFRETCFANAN